MNPTQEPAASAGAAKKRRLGLKSILLLQAAVLIYTLAGVMGKYASAQPFLSVGFVLFYGMEIAVLGLYALLWQQLIKRFDLSVAYANRAMALLWSMLWAVLLFHETVTWKNLLGAVIVAAGTLVVNGENNG